MEILGERWALLVVRELHTGPKRFTDIKAALPGISSNILTQRLEGLELTGIVCRRVLPPPAASTVYDLTEWGLQSAPVLMELGRWAARSPWLHGTHFSPASFMLSLRTMFDPHSAKGVAGQIDFQLGDTRLTSRIGNGQIEIVPGEGASPDLVLSGPAEAVGSFIYGGVPLAQLETEGVVTVAGDRGLADVLPGCFPLPETAEKPDG
ncbi:winged helix-turn-helix transcriptional regulator [Maricaulis sp.]|uniref:winged helix-turn-helix transcriptional regulator n=1 Tax=Maricaulis sp. TaxID=1486257 RepID=UPI00260B8AF1|nr:winged helix-turn-helix transcriptional regulator [Maricaulis sp.]